MLSAARAIGRTLTSLGLDWHDFANALAGTALPAPANRVERLLSFVDAVATHPADRLWIDRLSRYYARHGRLSERQMAVLSDIAGRCSPCLRPPTSTTRLLPGRQPPHNIEAEMAPARRHSRQPASLRARSRDFSGRSTSRSPSTGGSSTAARWLGDQGKLADSVTMKSYLDHTGALDEVGGTAYIDKLIDYFVTPSNAGEYGRLVHELHIRRVVIADAQDVLNSAYNGADDMREAVRLAPIHDRGDVGRRSKGVPAVFGARGGCPCQGVMAGQEGDPEDRVDGNLRP